ncbi:hypothetical protein OB236_23805 [Paenibacillus sp. WQ 127069]|uniref:Uncharacterized protein n=2 Tax=Paenibacillus baimaensis TaxID=2982185 RepID=A0ABT2UKH0_9BACL|nr:hypothetical protein [Paenibacillus sp. WQ 127069]
MLPPFLATDHQKDGCVIAPSINRLSILWDWMQKIIDKTLTASELAFLNTVLDGRVDRDLEV